MPRNHSRRPTTHIVACVAVMMLAASTARAELLFFSSGRTLSVQSHQVEGGSLVIQLRGGGEIICDASVISRIEPDEVPYPEPNAAADATGPRTVPYAALIEQIAGREGVDARLVKAVIQVESGYQQRARSPKGAMGLMQLMPKTARAYVVRDPYDPEANIEAGIKHLKALLERFPLALALAAYNAGEAAVEKFGGIPPYGETRSYVSRILQLAGSD
jgi:soluble lytic murein transglycosylase-like protein